MSKSTPPEHAGEVHRLKVYPDERPKTRGECADMPRPCPFLSCRYHLAHQRVAPHHGSGLDDDEAVDLIVGASETCTLDIADKDGVEQEEIAAALGVTRQAIAAMVIRARDRYKPDAQRLADLALEDVYASEGDCSVGAAPKGMRSLWLTKAT